MFGGGSRRHFRAALLGKLPKITKRSAGRMEGLLGGCQGGLRHCQAAHEIGNAARAGQRDPATA
jgi:hypothetical protein